MRCVVAHCLFALAPLGLVAADRPKPAITVAELRAPAPVRAVGASLTRGPRNALWLSWVEPGRNGFNSLRYSTLEPATRKWRSARSIVSGTDVGANPMDFPQLAIGSEGNATAIWTDGKGGAVFSESLDGIKWSKRLPWTGESSSAEMFSV